MVATPAENRYGGDYGRPGSRCRHGLLILVLLALAGCERPPAGSGEGAWPRLEELASAGRSLVVVLSDTHRLDHVSAYRTGEIATPSLELLAREGVRFTAARTPVPISAPAYATLLTGLEPAEHGLLNNQQPLAAGPPLLAERLRDAGYETAAAVANPFASAGHGFARGFDSFWDGVEEKGKEGEHVTRAALDWLERRDPGRPFFLFLAYMDAHSPYLSETVPPSLLVEVAGETCCVLRAENAHVVQRIPLAAKPGTTEVRLTFLDDLRPAEPAEGESPLHLVDLATGDPRLEARFARGWREIEGTRYRRMLHRATVEVTNPTRETVAGELRFRAYRLYGEDEIPALYRAGVESFDRELGRLRAALERRGLWDETIVVFVSDHGEMLGEHGSWGHVSDLYEETLHVPLIVKSPGLPAGTRFDGRFGLRDLHDLLLALATGPDESHARFPYAGTAPSELTTAATYPPEAKTLLVAVRGERYKLLTDGADRHELYDLVADPRERRDLWGELQDRPEVRRLAERARQELARAASVPSLDPDALTAEETERLRALGYL